MSRLLAWERRLAPFAISNLTLYLVIGQTFVYLTAMLGLLDARFLMFLPALVLQGEWWRVLTFVLVPPNAHWLFIAFALYLLYLFGSALEEHWGVVRYNLFLLFGYLLTVGLAFVTPYSLASNVFIGGAIFLAFAWLNPDFTLNLFLILPVKIKWLALIAWVFYAYTVLTGSLAAKLGVVAALGNFALFLGRDVIRRVRDGQRLRTHRGRHRAEAPAGPLVHRCRVCERTSVTHPELDFRYRDENGAEVCYCWDHLPSRQTKPEDQSAPSP